jgi:uncharacterized protein (TIGR02145 family)
MNRIAFLFLLCLFVYYTQAQDIQITFSVAGSGAAVDSVSATNLRTGRQISMPGTETLVLRQVSGTADAYDPPRQLSVFPNPFAGESRILVSIEKPQEARLRIQNMLGQVVAQSSGFLQAGVNEIEFSLGMGGFYSILLETRDGVASSKVVCLSATGMPDGIHFNGSNPGLRSNSSPTGPEAPLTGYYLDYADGDVIKYVCYSRSMTTIITDIPTGSRNFPVEFAECRDQSGKGYAAVRIGDQVWMAENLAYLPAVSPPSDGSNIDKYYYVYRYYSNNVAEAKALDTYSEYGVLYNWAAAVNGGVGSNSVPSGVQGACPDGWHIPSDEEWKVLERNLGMDEAEVSKTGWRNSGTAGGKLKEAGNAHWANPNTGADNSTGFAALPGGNRVGGGYFNYMPLSGSYWTCSEAGSIVAWLRHFYHTHDGVDRQNYQRRDGLSVRCVKNPDGSTIR